MIYVLLPAYNEEKGLTELLPELIRLTQNQSQNFKIVVVDDGSTDKTSEVAKSFQSRLNLELITFEKNKGVGEVFKAGFEYVCSESETPEEDICIALDSDNTQDPKKMFEMIERMQSGNDIIIASRFKGEGHMVGCPWHRQMYSFVISWILQIISGLPRVKDYSTFYRSYRVSLLQKGFECYGENLFTGKGFAIIAAFLLKLSNLTSRIDEIPLILRYDLKQGSSGNKIIKTITGYIELVCDYLISNRYKKLMLKPKSAFQNVS